MHMAAMCWKELIAHLVRLTLDAQVHDVVAANSTVIDNDVCARRVAGKGHTTEQTT